MKKKRSVWTFLLAAAVPWACWIWLGLSAGRYPLIYRGPPLIEHAAVVIAAAIFALLACIPIGRAFYSAADRRRDRGFMMPIALFFGFPIALSILFGMMVLNGYLDSSMERRFETRVIAQETGYRAGYRVVMEDWLDRSNVVRVVGPRPGVLPSIRKGMALSITTRTGYFNTEWMAGVEEKPSTDAAQRP